LIGNASSGNLARASVKRSTRSDADGRAL